MYQYLWWSWHCSPTFVIHSADLWSVIKPPCLLSWIRFVSENLELVALHLDITSTVLNTTSPKVQEWTFHEVESLMFFEKAMALWSTVSMLVSVLQVRSDRDKFTVYLDVKHFSPDDLSVRICDDYVEIQGKHGERQVVILIFVL